MADERNTAAEAAAHQRVQAQFGSAAAAYSTSPGHSDTQMLARVVELARPKPKDKALDIATGAGHTAMALAPHVAQVTAYDLTPQMLEETARNAAARGITNLVTRQGAAEHLPFDDNSFDIVTVRQAPHHFADIRRAIAEMARVTKPDGLVVIVDSRGFEDAEVDRAYDYIERLRDPSHVRNYSPQQWRAMVNEAGLRVTFEHLDFYNENGGPMGFSAWTSRMKTPPAAVAELRHLFREASPTLAAALRISFDGGEVIGFYVPQITIAAVKAAV
ncbi:MAG: class I SAM-dependent methyltransferase [Candidatus Binataceae bacterium]